MYQFKIGIYQYFQDNNCWVSNRLINNYAETINTYGYNINNFLSASFCLGSGVQHNPQTVFYKGEAVTLSPAYQFIEQNILLSNIDPLLDNIDLITQSMMAICTKLSDSTMIIKTGIFFFNSQGELECVEEELAKEMLLGNV